MPGWAVGLIAAGAAALGAFGGIWWALDRVFRGWR
jgi:hypothetical protein